MRFRSLLAGLTVAAFTAALGMGPVLQTSLAPDMGKPPGGGGGGGGEPLTWSDPNPYGSIWTWTQAAALAADYDDGVYDDWRLPTVDETLAAIAGGSWGTPSSGWGVFWTADTRGGRGGRSAYAVYIHDVDEFGLPILETTTVELFMQGSYMEMKFVRP